MPLCHLSQILQYTSQRPFTICCVQVFNLESLRAAINAAQSERSPLVLSIQYFRDKQGEVADLMPACVAASRRASVPIALMGRVCDDAQLIQTAINLGCNAVHVTPEHYSGSVVERLIELSDMVHTVGVSFILNFDAGEAEDIAINLIEDAAKCIQLDGLQCNANELLDQCAEVCAHHHVPLIAPRLNGRHQIAMLDCTYALLDEYEKAVVNQFSSIGSQRVGLDPLNRNITDAMRAHVVGRIAVCNSKDQAEQVAAEVPVWREIEHLIIFNVNESMDERAVQDMLDGGRRLLTGIPGVRRVFTGKAVKADAKFQYCWLIRFCDEKTIESYKSHPVHVAFADQQFRPVAGDRISVDYFELDAE